MQIAKYGSLSVAIALVQVAQTTTSDLPAQSGDSLISRGSDLAIYVRLAVTTQVVIKNC